MGNNCDILDEGARTKLVDTLNLKIREYTLNIEALARFLVTLEECKHYKAIDRKITAKHNAKNPKDRAGVQEEYGSRKIRLYPEGVSYDESMTIYLSKINTIPELVAEVQRWIESKKESIALFQNDLGLIDELTQLEKTFRDNREAARDKYKVSYITDNYFPRIFDGFQA